MIGNFGNSIVTSSAHYNFSSIFRMVSRELGFNFIKTNLYGLLQ